MSGVPRGSIRIVAGRHRGRRIVVPGGRGVRPTGDKVREAVFDVLQDVHHLRVLDLFAGSGALGLEAVSRGAQECVFVENDARVAGTLRKNIVALREESLASVMVADYRRAVSILVERGEQFDLLFVDPPYRMLAEVEVCLMPQVPTLLSQAGLLVAEGPASISVSFGGTVMLERDYGDTRLTIIGVRRSDP